MTRGKIDFTVRCVDCGKTEKIHDYPGRWKTGEYRCERCFDAWYKQQPPVKMNFYNMMTGEFVETQEMQR